MATQSDTFYPFDAGSGSTVTEAQWPLLALCWGSMAAHERGGVVDTGGGTDLLVTADGTAREVTMATGTAIIDGHIIDFTSPVTLAITANSTGSERLDVVVLRTDRANNRGEVDLITGATLTNNVVNEITQNANVWEVEIARVFAPTGSTPIAAADVHESRLFVDTPPKHEIGSYVWSRVDTLPANGIRWIPAAGVPVSKATYRLLYNLVGGFGSDPTSKTFVASPDVTTVGRLKFSGSTDATGGSDSVTLSSANLPAHTHTMSHTHGLNSHTHPAGSLGLNTGGIKVVIGDVGSSTQFLNSGPLADHGGEDVSLNSPTIEGNTGGATGNTGTPSVTNTGSVGSGTPITIDPRAVGAYLWVVAR